MLLNNRVAIVRASATTAATAVALTATLGLAAASWVVAVRQMNGQINGTNMGAATPLGSFAFFMALWVAMMAAMMLPGAAPAILRSAHARGVRIVPLFVGSYLAVWTLVHRWREPGNRRGRYDDQESKSDDASSMVRPTSTCCNHKGEN